MNSPATSSSAIVRIREHIETGRLQQAIEAADVAMESSTSEDRPLILCLKSLALVTTGKSLEALRVATTAHELAVPITSAFIEAEALLAVGFALQSLEEHARAIEAITQAERLAKQSGDLALQARVLRRLGISCSILGRHQQAEEILSQVVDVLEHHGTLVERYHARYSMLTARSRAADAIDEHDTKRQSHYRSLMAEWHAFVESASAHDLTRLELMGLANAGIAAHRAGDYEVSLATLQRAIAGHAQAGLRGHEAVAQNHVGSVLLALGRKQDAIDAFKRGIALQEGGNPRDLMEAWEELAGAYESIDDPRLALAAYKKAREFERTLHDDDARLAAARREQREEIARLADQWGRLAEEDALTGIANRRAFEKSLAVMLDGARAGQHFSLLYFDLDHFKHVNDTFGHAGGDSVLRRFAQLLRADRRAGDLPARIGGEEFALILPLDSKQQAADVADRINLACRAVDWHSIAPDLHVTVSIGVATSHEIELAELSQDSLCALADRRLYRAKNDGRDRVDFAG